MQQAGREKEKESYGFWTPVYSLGLDMLPEQISAAAEDLTPCPKPFTAWEPGQRDRTCVCVPLLPLCTHPISSDGEANADQ